MTEEQRARLEKYAGAPNEPGRHPLDHAILAALAEVDRLRAELATVTEERNLAYAEHTQEATSLRAELAAAKAEPPRLAAIVRIYDPIETHAFETHDDARAFIQGARYYTVVNTEGPWISHPATKDGA